MGFFKRWSWLFKTLSEFWRHPKDCSKHTCWNSLRLFKTSRFIHTCLGFLETPQDSSRLFWGLENNFSFQSFYSGAREEQLPHCLPLYLSLDILIWTVVATLTLLLMTKTGDCVGRIWSKRDRRMESSRLEIWKKKHENSESTFPVCFILVQRSVRYEGS